MHTLIPAVSVIFACVLVQCTFGLPRLNYVNTFEEVELVEQFTSQSGINILYYYQKGIKRMTRFLKAYNDSASHLQAYNIHLAMVDCTKKGVLLLEKCQDKESRKEISIYRNKKLLLSVPRVNMFDVESIMSNALQVLLLKDVPLVQTVEELDKLEERVKGHTNVVFSYQHAIGTYEHRVLMEVAYTYRSMCKFALTTMQSTVQSLPGFHTSDMTSIWLFKCADVREGEPCEILKYAGNFDLISVMQFVQTVNIPLVTDAGTEGDADPYADINLHAAVFVYDQESRGTVSRVAHHIRRRFYGILGIVLVDKDHKPAMTSIEKFGKLERVPQLILIARGEAGQFYGQQISTDDRSLSSIYRFIHGVMKPVMEKEEKERIGHYMSDGQAEVRDFNGNTFEEDLMWNVETQDDPVSIYVQNLKAKNLLDPTKVTALTDKTFPQFTKEKPLTVVLFYLSFDDRSMAFIRDYTNAALSLADHGVDLLTRVECYDWTDVCAKNNITSYPTIRFYRQGRHYWEYRNILDELSITNAVKLFLSGSPIELKDREDMAKFREQKLPSYILNASSVSVLGVFNEKHKEELEVFKSIAEDFIGQIVLGYADESYAKDIFPSLSAPNLIIFKHHDPIKPTDIYNQPQQQQQSNQQPDQQQQQQFSHDAVHTFIQSSLIPVFPELTVYNFPSLYNQNIPLVIVFLEATNVTQHPVYNTIGDVALTSRLACKFVWMNITEENGIGRTVLSEYFDNPPAQAITMLDRKKGVIYNLGDVNPSKESVLVWLNKIQSQEIEPTKSLDSHEWKPLNPGYDFLAMMDNDLYQQANPKSCLNGRCEKKNGVRHEPEYHSLDFDESLPPSKTEYPHTEL